MDSQVRGERTMGRGREREKEKGGEREREGGRCGGIDKRKKKGQSERERERGRENAREREARKKQHICQTAAGGGESNSRILGAPLSKRGHRPERTCLGCGAREEQNKLIRLDRKSVVEQ